MLFGYPVTETRRSALFFLTGLCANVILFSTSQLNDLGVLLSANCMLRGALCDADLVGQMMLARSAASSLGDEVVGMSGTAESGGAVLKQHLRSALGLR